MTSGTDWKVNMATATRLLRQACDQQAVVAVLPENFSIMARGDAERRTVAERDGDGPIQQWLAQTARELGLWIVGGTTPLLLPDEPRMATSCLVYNSAGERVARYDKIHLFDVALPHQDESYHESAHFAPGHTPVVVDTPAGKLGLSVCYDLRFPELYRQLSAAGADWFCVPSAFTVPTGHAHWHTLLKARAIENLSFVVAAAQSGHHANGRATYGHSLIVHYWGEVLAELAAGEGVVCTEIDLAAQREARRKFPALTHRVLK
jgi:nitrilase